MAITRGATITHWSTTDITTSARFSHTANVSATFLLLAILLLAISLEAHADVTSDIVNWNANEAMTQIGSVETGNIDGNMNLWFFGLVNPTAQLAQ